MAAAIVAEGLAKRSGTVEALAGVDVTGEQGELVGLIGPTRGRAEILGAPAGSRPARAALGYLAELFRFPGWYSADEVLRLHQRLTGSEGGEAERLELLELVGLREARAKRVEAMSKGM